jgi:hypothetical protein
MSTEGADVEQCLADAEAHVTALAAEHAPKQDNATQ